MTTGIFRRNVIGELEEVQQRHIDAWCNECQFPLDEEEIDGKWVKARCKSKELIQQCWNDSGAIAGNWHKQHECPFIHLGQPCRCNDFKTIEKAFEVVGVKYQKG